MNRPTAITNTNKPTPNKAKMVRRAKRVPTTSSTTFAKLLLAVQLLITFELMGSGLSLRSACKLGGIFGYSGLVIR